MENRLVLLITMVHIGMDVSKFLRMGPILNQKNKIHVEKVWGKKVRFMS